MSKYPGFKKDDTKWDEHHRANGLMTNQEFFTSNAKGGFYEGMEWDEDSNQWVPNAEERQKQAAYEATLCPECKCKNCQCW